MNEQQTRRFNPKVGVTAMLTPEYAIEIEAAARRVGLTRHGLLVRAIEVGVPIALAQAGYQATHAGTPAAPQQQR